MGQTCDGCCADNTINTETPRAKGGKGIDGYGGYTRKDSLSTSNTATHDNDEFMTDDDEVSMSTVSDPNYDREHDHSMSYEPHSIDTKSTEEIMAGFRNAVESGNDALVMSLNEEYPSLDLLDYQFENGDNALHVAVRNKNYNLILYLLTNGISV